MRKLAMLFLLIITATACNSKDDSPKDSTGGGNGNEFSDYPTKITLPVGKSSLSLSGGTLTGTITQKFLNQDISAEFKEAVSYTDVNKQLTVLIDKVKNNTTVTTLTNSKEFPNSTAITGDVLTITDNILNGLSDVNKFCMQYQITKTVGLGPLLGDLFMQGINYKQLDPRTFEKVGYLNEVFDSITGLLDQVLSKDGEQCIPVVNP